MPVGIVGSQERKARVGDENVVGLFERKGKRARLKR
jgi:hypothetical protein